MKPETIIGFDGVEVCLIHWQMPDGRICCMPGLKHMASDQANGRQVPHVRSTEKVAATCPMCKKMPEFKQ